MVYSTIRGPFPTLPLLSSEICNIYGVTNVIDKPTCFKSSQGTLIDPVLVTNKGRVATSINVTCGFSDWHNIVGCVTKIHMPRQHPTRIFYRSYQNQNTQEKTSTIYEQSFEKGDALPK